MLLNCGVGEDSWESLDCMEIKPVSPKGNQPWIFTGRTDAKAPVLWPPDAQDCLIGKDPDAGKDWRLEEKGTTEDEMVGWHHWLDGYEFEQALGVGGGQGSLACCSLWGCRVRHDWVTELNWPMTTNYPLSRIHALNGHNEESVFCLEKYRWAFLLRFHQRLLLSRVYFKGWFSLGLYPYATSVLSSLLRGLLLMPLRFCYKLPKQPTSFSHSSDLWTLKNWKNQNLELEDSGLELGKYTSSVTLLSIIFQVCI